MSRVQLWLYMYGVDVDVDMRQSSIYESRIVGVQTDILYQRRDFCSSPVCLSVCQSVCLSVWFFLSRLKGASVHCFDTGDCSWAGEGFPPFPFSQLTHSAATSVHSVL